MPPRSSVFNLIIKRFQGQDQWFGSRHLYGIVAKHPEPEDVLYAMLTMHRKDGSNAFKQALAAFGVTWERKAKTIEKVPA